MYVSYEPNEYHHLTIREIKDKTEKNIPYILLYCDGKTITKDFSIATGNKITSYKVTVECRKGLIDYVYSELSVNDNIFVIGNTKTVKYNKYIHQRYLLARCIYREDWMSFFRGTNPEDFEI